MDIPGVFWTLDDIRAYAQLAAAVGLLSATVSFVMYAVLWVSKALGLLDPDVDEYADLPVLNDGWFRPSHRNVIRGDVMAEDAAVWDRGEHSPRKRPEGDFW